MYALVCSRCIRVYVCVFDVKKNECQNTIHFFLSRFGKATESFAIGSQTATNGKWLENFVFFFFSSFLHGNEVDGGDDNDETKEM